MLNVILRFTCNSPTPKVTIYKCVVVYNFNVIMRKIPENMALHGCGVVWSVTTEIQNETGSIITQARKEDDRL